MEKINFELIKTKLSKDFISFYYTAVKLLYYGWQQGFLESI